MWASAQDLTIRLPAGLQATSASAVNAGMKLTATGQVEGDVIRITKLLPLTPYDVIVKLGDGTVLQGASLKWYNEEPVDPIKEPLTEEDRAEIGELVKSDKEFMDKQEILHLAGDHHRATALMKLVRDRGFYSNKGGEIICRFELWYFRFEAGGWMKIQQGSKVLRRDRFESKADYDTTISPIRWIPELGSITFGKGEKEKTITLTSTTGIGQAAPTTQPGR
jgi:hypothetical protein